MKRKYLLGALLYVAAPIFAASLLYAQHENRSLSGIVTDKQSEPLRGAVVQAHNLETHTVVSFITGRNGQYSFRRLDGDCDYKISRYVAQAALPNKEPESV